MEGGLLHRLLYGMHNRFQKRFRDSWLLTDREELERLQDTTCCMFGFGGVGTITVELLARLGIKRFRLLDLDRYAESNIGRQLFATTRTLGRYKAEVAAERILEINPSAELEAVLCERVTSENAERLIQGADMVIQTADTPSALMLYEIAKKHRVPLVNAYCANYKCYVQVYDNRKDRNRSWVESMKDRIKWKDRRNIHEMSTEELKALDSSQYAYEQVCPPVNFTTNTAGCLIVSEAVKVLLNRGRRTQHPRRIQLDLLNLKLKVENTYSLFRLENYMRFLTLIKGRNHLDKIQNDGARNSDGSEDQVNADNHLDADNTSRSS